MKRWIYEQRRKCNIYITKINKNRRLSKKKLLQKRKNNLEKKKKRITLTLFQEFIYLIEWCVEFISPKIFKHEIFWRQWEVNVFVYMFFTALFVAIIYSILFFLFFVINLPYLLSSFILWQEFYDAHCRPFWFVIIVFGIIFQNWWKR